MKPDILNSSMLSDRQSTAEEIRAAMLLPDPVEEGAPDEPLEILSDLGGYIRISSNEFETCLMVEELNRDDKAAN